MEGNLRIWLARESSGPGGFFNLAVMGFQAHSVIGFVALLD